MSWCHRKCLMYFVSLMIVFASIILPAAPVAASEETVTTEVLLTLSSSNIYQRPLYPADVDGSADQSLTYVTSEIEEANLYNPNEFASTFSYDTYELTPSTSGLYTFKVTGDSLDYAYLEEKDEFYDRDLMFWLYESTFDPVNPLTNILAMNDSGDDSPDGYYLYPKLDFQLTAGTTYVLVTTTYYPETTGGVTLSITSPTVNNANDEPSQDDGSLDSLPDEEEEKIEENSSVILPSEPSTPVKRDPITILHSLTGMRTEDLSYLAAIPEQWMADVTYVEFWLDAVPITTDSPRQAAVKKAEAAIAAAGRKLYDSCEVSLMSRVTWCDHRQVTSPIDPTCIHANIPIYLPIPGTLAAIPEIGIACIDDSGAVAFLDSERVTIEGIDYVRFENNNLPAVYAFVY